jgi:hypothetical protein
MEQWRARNFFPPYSRAAATAFHRLPGTESAVNVAERSEFRQSRKFLAPLRVNGIKMHYH